jgi:hypothetical protein
MTIEVKEETNGSFTIYWDENDPSESMFNTWTEDDFKNAIESHIKKLMEEDESNGKG